MRTIDAEDIRREKGTYTREKNLLFLKNLVSLMDDGNLKLLPSIRKKNQIDDLKFTDIFAGPEPVFEVSKRGKCGPTKKATGTLDGWVTKPKASDIKKQLLEQKQEQKKIKKQTAAEIEAEMKKMKEQQERFKEEMRKRAEEAKLKKIEDKAKEKERKKEEKRLITELLNDWKKPREDLECEDLKELPKTLPVHNNSIPNHLFGDVLSLLEFFHGFSNLLEVSDSFGDGINFHVLEQALGKEFFILPLESLVAEGRYGCLYKGVRLFWPFLKPPIFLRKNIFSTSKEKLPFSDPHHHHPYVLT